MDWITIDAGSPALPGGFRVGHWTNDAASSGCTVVLPPPGNVTGVDARGPANGSRELSCLDLARARSEVHAIVLTGGSAYGLAAADGAMRRLEERRVGFAVGDGVVPIVPAAVILDRSAFDPAARPGPDAGYAACMDAEHRDGAPVARGRVGAGAGATVGKWAGLEHGVAGGLGCAAAEGDGERVVAIAVANPAGDVVADDGSVIAGTTNPDARLALPPPREGANTVLAVVMFEGRATKQEATFVAARGSDGITRAVRPAHMRFDGDVVFAVAGPDMGRGEPRTARLDVIGILATAAVSAAIRDAVR